MAKQCYMVSLQAQITSTIPIEGLDTHDELIKEQGKPLEDLLTISLHDGNPEHVIHVGSKLDETLR